MVIFAHKIIIYFYSMARNGISEDKIKYVIDVETSEAQRHIYQMNEKLNELNKDYKNLDKYLQFAQMKAQQTGQSVEFMTQSIVTGLGRQSKMILDNLGISAAEIDKKNAETSDFIIYFTWLIKRKTKKPQALTVWAMRHSQ